MRVDFRSDTVTKPTQGMLDAMFSAEVGDDVFVEDPTINALEQKSAKLFGLEAGLFCPSGTQTNQIAINTHTRPGDEVICDVLSHIHVYEGGGIAANSGVSTTLLSGEKGQITASQIEEVIKADNVHFPKSSLVSLENTCNKAGGTVYKLNQIQEIQALCTAHKMALHLDGARIFNAFEAAGYSSLDIGKCFDSISICLSKGLGAPVGSVLVGTQEFIHQARRVRKRFGGGMRQAGYLAAAGIYALDNNVDRLKVDHENAIELGKAFENLAFVTKVTPVESNIVMVHFDSPDTTEIIMDLLIKNDIHALTLTPTSIRLVTHLDVSSEQFDFALNYIFKMNLS